MTTEQFITYKYKKLNGDIKYISVDPNKSLFYDIEFVNDKKDILEPDHTHVLVYDVDEKNKTLIIKNIIGISQNHTFYYEEEEDNLSLEEKLNSVCLNIYIICGGFMLGIFLFFI